MSLERYQHVAAIVPTFAPIGMGHLFARFELAWWCQIAIYAVWGIVALASVAFMLQRDRLKAERHVEQRVREVGTDIKQLASDFSQTTSAQEQETEALRDRVDRMERALREQLDVHLPIIVHLAGSANVGPVTASARLEVVGPQRRRLVRIWRWIGLQGRRLKRCIWGERTDNC